MLSNISATTAPGSLDYPQCDSSLRFADYISECRDIIAKERPDLQANHTTSKLILDANSPYELRPAVEPSSGKYKNAALLIHGLLDCPFSLRDIGEQLRQEGVLCRSILLPGHGVTPAGLMNVTYQDWINAVKYGVEQLKKDADEITLIGYSTGAALSIYQALQDAGIKNIVLLSPAIRIKAPVDIVVGWRQLTKCIQGNIDWLYKEPEVDYSKYLSITFNAVSQVSQLTDVIHELRHQSDLKQPMLMIMSREDETVSSHHAIDYFSSIHHPQSEMLLYTSVDHRYPDSRVMTRTSHHPDLGIHHFSHISIPFAPSNPHYGQQGDYIYAAHKDKNYIYGAYNRLELKFFDLLNKLRIAKGERRELTYNPDFDFMANKIANFVKA